MTQQSMTAKTTPMVARTTSLSAMLLPSALAERNRRAVEARQLEARFERDRRYRALTGQVPRTY